jgi:hypothetical protein
MLLIDHRGPAVALSLALAVALAGCSDGGSTCEDCGCGNGILEAGESCDGADLGGATCVSATSHGGVLGCNNDCTLDTSGCTLPGCGNGIVETGEACDGADLGGGSCTDIGYSGGDIACSADCTYDTAGCCTDACLVEGATMCVGDLLRVCTTQPSGCVAWTITDCAANHDVCDATGGDAACVCIDRCPAAGNTRCEGAAIETCTLEPDGCLDWIQTTDCATGGEVCANPPSGPTCVADASAEDCADPYPLAAGENVVAWTAVDADYLSAQPSCNTTAFAGPDLVLSYTAPDDGFVSFAMAKPVSQRQVVVVSSAACGSLEPELGCVSAFAETEAIIDLEVEDGTTYYFYVRDTTSGTMPLDNPLIVTLDEALCSTIDVELTSLSPPNGSSVPDLTPLLTAQFAYPIAGTAGVITVTGNLGTNLTYDLATGPAEIAIVDNGRTLIIDPGVVFPAGETVTVTWSGLLDATCDSPIDPPVWTFEVAGPPCTPGTDGMVGSTITRIPTTISSISEQYVAADPEPDGYVYVGGLTQLFRLPKAGGAIQDVVTAAPLTSSHLGYDMLVVGDSIFTMDSNITATSNVLWRISTTGGDTWTVQNYMQLPQTPNDDLRGMTHHDGRIYMTTDEVSAGTEIWSVPVDAATLPVTAVLETTVPTDEYCTGVAVDDAYFYLGCYSLDRILRVDRTTFAVEVLTDAFDMNITKNALHVHDIDGDGLADVLYVSSYYEEVDYICEPAGAGPWVADVLASFGSATSNYGLGFDPVARVLWMFDDDTREFIKIE